MIYKNIEIHNIAEIIPAEDGEGITWLRTPSYVHEHLENAKGCNKNSTGVELRFVMKSDTVTLRLKAEYLNNVLNTFHVYRGSIQGGWEDHEFDKLVRTQATDIVIKKSNNIEDLKKISKEYGYPFDPEVVRVIFDRGRYTLIDVIGDVEPPKPEQCPSKTFYAYGSSITHGSNSIDMSHSWVSVIAHNLKYDSVNLGMAGSCFMENEIIDYIAQEGKKGKWNFAILELGINVVHWQTDVIRERVSYILDSVAKSNSDKPVFIVSPFYCNDDFHNGGRADNWRRNISEVIAEKNYSNVTYVNGLDMLGDMSLISADATHPNIFGCQQIAERLTARIKEVLKNFEK